MYTVYVLKDKSGKTYKGATSNINERLAGHLSGNTRSTRMMDKPRLVYSEDYSTWQDARKRELYLKSAAGRKFLKKTLGG